MSTVGFKDRFVPKVESGEKTHTIRGRRRDIRVGTRLDLYARPRQKGMRLIFRVPCTKIEEIRLEYRAGTGSCELPHVVIQGIDLSPTEVEAFARRDGFDDFADMVRWWNDTRDIPFQGCIYHWRFSERRKNK